MSFLGKIFGGLGSNEGVIEELKPIVEQINALEPEFKKLSDKKLKKKLWNLEKDWEREKPSTTFSPKPLLLKEEINELNKEHKKVLAERGSDISAREQKEF